MYYVLHQCPVREIQREIERAFGELSISYRKQMWDEEVKLNASRRGARKPGRNPLTQPGGPGTASQKKKPQQTGGSRRKWHHHRGQGYCFQNNHPRPLALPAKAHYIQMTKLVRDPDFLAQCLITGQASKARKSNPNPAILWLAGSPSRELMGTQWHRVPLTMSCS